MKIYLQKFFLISPCLSYLLNILNYHRLSCTAQVCKNLVIIEVITEEKASMAGRLRADMVCGIKQEQEYASATVEDQLLWMWKDSTPL